MVSKSLGESSKAGSAVPAANDSDWIYRPMMDLRQRMDELFDSFGSGWQLPSMATPFAAPPPTGAVAVQFDVVESDDAIEVSVELPGIDEKDVEVTLEGGLLTVKGEKKAESEKKNKDHYVMERRYGAFRRSFRLPDGLDESKVTAKFDKGVLQIVLPKAAEAKRKAKKVPIDKA